VTHKKLYETVEFQYIHTCELIYKSHHSLIQHCNFLNSFWWLAIKNLEAYVGFAACIKFGGLGVWTQCNNEQ